MKRKLFIFVLIIAIVGGGAFAFTYFAPEASAWRAALQARTTGGYLDYLAAYPNGAHAADAEKGARGHLSTSQSIEDMQRFIDMFPGDSQCDEAQDRIEYLRYDAVRNSKDIAELEAVLALPGDRYDHAIRLLIDGVYWSEARASGDIAKIQAYREMPEAAHIQDANMLIENIRWDEIKGGHDVEKIREYLATPNIMRRDMAKDLLSKALYYRLINGEGSAEEYAEFMKTKADYNDRYSVNKANPALFWAATEEENTVKAYNHFRQVLPDHEYAQLALDRIRDIQDAEAWRDLNKKGPTIRELQAFIAAHERSAYSQEAAEKIEALRTDESVYDAWSQNASSRLDVEQFLQDYPGHVMTDQVKAQLPRLVGTELLDLIAKDMVEVKALGDRINQTSMAIINKGDTNLRVNIRAGTYFIAASNDTQNMLITQTTSLVINGNDAWTGPLPTACMNMGKHIPNRNDQFTVGTLDELHPLTRLVASDEWKKLGFSAKQAAVWIITDNASDAQLQERLVYDDGYRPSELDTYLGDHRLHQYESAIKPADITQARALLAELGIDV